MFRCGGSKLSDGASSKRLETTSVLVIANDAPVTWASTT
jgi:hypothetical protein